MTTSTALDRFGDRVAAGERLTLNELHELASTPDILALGMLADTARRRLHGSRATFLRVAAYSIDADFEQVPPAAAEVRVTGRPADLDSLAATVRRARAAAGTRTVSGFSWSDIERVTEAGPGRVAALGALRLAGLDALAELPLDEIGEPVDAVECLVNAGFSQLRLTIGAGTGTARESLFAVAAELQDRFTCIQAIDPLPLTRGAFRPTTGYDDVKMIALARLAAPNVSTVQVDWLRYGPKLAQVGLTFGADDIDGVSASDDAPEGRRRRPLEEVRRNIEAAGFEPVERNGRFVVLS
jgi:hypothetical protein